MGTARRFRVFVAGTSWRSQHVVRALHDLCAAHGVDDYVVEVIDVLDDPEAAEEHRVLALPLVIRLSPEPVVRIVGDLSDTNVATSALGLSGGPAPDDLPEGGPA